ncbi:MAG: hypothetical protein BA864_13315 [Desulfuromonadales bacterium C00003093]|nr:MAG: hypothetical protein BA864_13315 [Desulfuromonadales bacterium C00003093]
MAKISFNSIIPLTLCVMLLFVIVGCVSSYMPRQMLTGTAEREDNTSSTTFKKFPAPGITLITSEPSTVTAFFVAECRVSSPGKKLEVRIKVDDQVVSPDVAVLTTNNQYESHSFLATTAKAKVPPGTHMVTVEWRVSGGKAFVRNRSFTVWEVKYPD